MHPRIRPLTLAVLLAATACVSVPGTPPPPAPGPAPAGAPSPASLSPERPAEQAPAHAELASTGPEKPPRPRPADGRAGGDGRRDEAREPGGADAPRGRERRAAVPEKPAHGRQGGKARAEEARSPHKHRMHTGVRPPRVRTHYDMGDLCRASDGVADQSLVAMCRASYGR
ncbi:hypothetical protein [Streptomyces sp. WMMC940]|uniref:hypothetical protein n=1 Tax=Streptomyces sp. WMMC940 TaxID=3015153 RepID=UPI0022B6D271|nr:hypothetical protein [Streptomyces sp. WMMC940]MCZ7456845.1 hypothetical protein [Streptomyces sp. WMMC940]